MTYDPNQPATPEPGPTPTTPAAPAPTAWPASTATAPVAASPVTTVPGPAPVIPAAKSKGSSGRLLNIVLGVAIAVAIGGVAFAVGRSTAPASAASTGRGGFAANNPNASFAPRGSGAPGFGGGRGAFGGFGGAGLTINGTVQSVDGDTVTIKTANGQTIEVTTGADTTYHTQASASATDVTEGKTVQVQITPTGGGNGGGFRPGASGAPSGPVGTAGSITVVP